MVRPTGSNGFKVIFTLLAKVIAVKMEILIIEFRELSLQQLLLKLYLDWRGSLILVISVGFHELLE